MDGLDALAADPQLAPIVAAHGRPPEWSRPEGFPALAYLILEQQVSLESAAAALRRLRAEIGEPTPERILDAGEDRLRAAGVTRQKARYLSSLARTFLDGFDSDALRSLPDDEVRTRLTSLHGIGRWTADVYLISSLGRPDVWPSGDRALLVATAETLGLDDVPSGPESEELAARWGPYRTAAARILWHGYLHRRGRTPTDPLAAA
jgi:DNA-3-methyladenine glycosylase II